MIRRGATAALATLVVAVTALLGFALHDAGPLPVPAGGDHPTTAPYRVTPALVPGRAARSEVYPYSVVPGGVRTRAELTQAVSRDRVVAAHYASLRTDRIEPAPVPQARRVHVSYRLADRVFWTRRKVSLKPGELLLSDGTHEVRARCGNRISDELLGETSPYEPSEVVLDTPTLRADERPGSPVLPPLQAYHLFTTNGALPPPVGIHAPAGDPAFSGGSSVGGPVWFGGPLGHGGATTDGGDRPADPPGKPETFGGDPPPGSDDPPGPPQPPGPPDPPWNPPPGPPEDPPDDPHPVPEPTTLLLVGFGGLLLAMRRFSGRA